MGWPTFGLYERLEAAKSAAVVLIPGPAYIPVGNVGERVDDERGESVVDAGAVRASIQGMERLFIVFGWERYNWENAFIEVLYTPAVGGPGDDENGRFGMDFHSAFAFLTLPCSDKRFYQVNANIDSSPG